jgi:hypothetical protein
MNKKILSIILLISCVFPAQNIFAKDDSVFCRRNRMIAEGMVGAASFVTYFIYRKKVINTKAQRAALNEGVLLPGDTIAREKLEKQLRKYRNIRNTALGVFIASGLLFAGEAICAYLDDSDEKPKPKPKPIPYNYIYKYTGVRTYSKKHGNFKVIICDNENIVTKEKGENIFTVKVVEEETYDFQVGLFIDKTLKEFNGVKRIVQEGLLKKDLSMVELMKFCGRINMVRSRSNNKSEFRFGQALNSKSDGYVSNDNDENMIFKGKKE